MTSHCPLNSESISRFPYVDRISVREKEDQVDFVYQYVKDCDVFLTHNDTEHYMLGKPINFPKYGNFPETFTTKTYGDVSISPWQDEQLVPWSTRHAWNIDFMLSLKKIDLSNYIYIEFHEAVYPIRVSIYEVYNPGYITEILAENEGHWYLLEGIASDCTFDIKTIFSTLKKLQLQNQ